MASTSATRTAAVATFASTRRSASAPWYLWSLVAALSLVTLGGQLDVSWHRSIGRDTFWTPPHMMVYACGLIAGFTCAWLILAATFNARPGLRACSVNVFGLRAPLGVLVTAWGGLTMLYSAPVDNWWHNAYGLDVQVQSPPHILLLAGTAAVAAGTLLLALAEMNRARLRDGDRANLAYERVFLVVGALTVIHLMSYAMSYTFDTRLHAAKAYIVMSMAVPFALAALAAAGRRRWSSTAIAAIYTAFMLVLVWGLPLIPASPRIGPVYQTVQHMVPPKFPTLILLPAFALDLIRRFLPRLNRWAAAALTGFTWVALLVAAEWPFASFLMTPMACNRFFATCFHDFGTPPGNPDVLRVFELPQSGSHLLAGLSVAVAVAIVGSGLGDSLGRWMRHVIR